MTGHTETATRRDVFAYRRFIFLFLPLVVAGMAVYFYSYTFTLTANGLSVLAGLWVIGWAGVAAWDSEDRS